MNTAFPYTGYPTHLLAWAVETGPWPSAGKEGKELTHPEASASC